MTSRVPLRRRRGSTRQTFLGLVFQVVWNSVRRTFDIKCDGAPIGRYAQDRDTAIVIATREARKEAAKGQEAAVYSIRDGIERIEWTSKGDSISTGRF
jgi:hypothetical protein